MDTGNSGFPYFQLKKSDFDRLFSFLGKHLYLMSRDWNLISL